MDRLIREVWVEAFSSPAKCAKMVEVLEALLPACKGNDRVTMQEAIEALRAYGYIMFPGAPELAQPTQLH